MNELTAIEYKNWKKVLIYGSINIEDEKEPIKNITLRLIWDSELENIKKMDIKDISKLVDDIINQLPIF